MKNFGIIIFLLLIGGGAYFYFQKPDTLKEMTDKVSELAGGGNFKKFKTYKSEVEKDGLKEVKEEESLFADFKNKMILTEFSDNKGGNIKFANDGTDVELIAIIYPVNYKGKLVKFSKDLRKYFFQEEEEFKEKGAIEGKIANCEWSTTSGVLQIVIYRKELEKNSSVQELSKELQDAIDEFRQLVTEKVEMEAKFQALDDERHFCFDPERFKAIENEMAELKKKAQEMTIKAQELLTKIPEQHVAKVRSELDGTSLK